MSDHNHLAETMDALAETIRRAPLEKREEIKTFLEGYTAALEHMLDKQEVP